MRSLPAARSPAPWPPLTPLTTVRARRRTPWVPWAARWLGLGLLPLPGLAPLCWSCAANASAAVVTDAAGYLGGVATDTMNSTTSEVRDLALQASILPPPLLPLQSGRPPRLVAAAPGVSPRWRPCRHCFLAPQVDHDVEVVGWGETEQGHKYWCAGGGGVSGWGWGGGPGWWGLGQALPAPALHWLRPVTTAPALLAAHKQDCAQLMGGILGHAQLLQAGTRHQRAADRGW